MNIKGLLVTKPIATYQKEASAEGLKRALGIPSLIAFGIGGIIGTGIFVLTGLAAAQHAGPAIAISFAIPSLQRWCRSRAAPTPTATRHWASSSPGSSAGI